MVLQPIISTPESLKQEDCHESGASLDYRAIQASLNCLERTEQTKKQKKKNEKQKTSHSCGPLQSIQELRQDL